ncbi:MAG: ComEC/Rec2 family competence protein [Treponema sp.]|nr:ComEC/Rec2 family competence protein [Treponema sp.]
MVGIQRPAPLLYAVLGAAGTYYGLNLLHLAGVRWISGVGAGVCVLLGILSLCRVLACSPGLVFSDPLRSRRCRGINRHVMALAAGLILGLCARAAVPYMIHLGLPQDRVTGISGVLREDPRELQDGRGMGYLELEGAAGKGGIRSSARGVVLVFFPSGAIPRLKEFGRGSAVYIEGSFVPPQSGGGSLFRARSVHILAPAPAWEQFRTGIRLGLLDRLAPYAWGGLGAALLLGIRDNLDTGLAQAYQYAGCSHVLALSGMHLAVLSGLLAFLLRRALGLRASAMAGAVFVLAYVYLVGAQASLERAAIMYLLGTAALLGVLPRRPAFLLGLAFLIQLALRPASGDSLSFILSYLALGGILFIGQALHDLIRGPVPEVLAGPLSASLGAYTATSAVSAAGFGVVRPIGIAAGLIIVPLTTLFMIGTLAWLALEPLIPVLARPVAAALSLVYALLGRLVSLAALVPGIVSRGPAVELALSLGAALLCICLRNRRLRWRNTLAPFP